ncbi:MAG TPA: relaxase/mobilization nuclease domain-containing protein, partial [Clostridia bacterium]|nr:relaxase/mobilization nuclease domain-containing protein [Clostridia bacterium]
MAICGKIHSIKVRLDERINYAITADKTKTLVDKIEYAINGEKTDYALYASVVNCVSVETAYAEMNEVKARYRKNGEVLGYTFIQSFPPEENVTPEEVHEIGARLAQEFFGERFQVVVGTHIDKAHLHNHFVINSVSFVDGIKYRNKLHYLKDLRAISDRLCREYGLSVVVPKAKNGTVPYTEWKERKTGTSQRDDLMRADIDVCLAQSLSFEEFISRIKARGYTIPRYGPTIKYMSIRPPGKTPDGNPLKARRIHELGDGYSEEAIRQRIAQNTPEMVRIAILSAHEKEQNVSKKPKVVRAFKGRKRYTRKKLTGLQARYYRILYTLGMIHKRPQSNRSIYFPLYDQVRQLDGYIRQMKLLTTHDVHSLDELFQVKLSLQTQIDVLLKERSALYRQNGKEVHKEQIGQLTGQLAELRRALRDCESIETRSVETDQRIRHAQEQEAERQRKAQQE